MNGKFRFWITVGLIDLILLLVWNVFFFQMNPTTMQRTTDTDTTFYYMKWKNNVSDFRSETIQNQTLSNALIETTQSTSSTPSVVEIDSVEPTSSSSKPPTSTKQQITQISLLGERNSGTNWIFSHLGLCFNHTLIVRRALTRYKHWFQYENTTKYYRANSTLVVAQFRNPYTWLMSMMHTPHHMPAHLHPEGNPTHLYSHGNDWKIFLTKTWTVPRTGIDLELMKQHPDDYLYLPCQEHFLFRDVVSCVKEPIPKEKLKHEPRFSDNQPFYEMRNDGSGLPYDNIMEMRSDKILNFLSVAHYAQVAEFLPVQYEYLVRKGTAELINQIATITGVEAKCKPDPPQKERPVKASRVITPDFAKHIRKHLNWTTEAMIGYFPERCYEERTCVQSMW